MSDGFDLERFVDLVESAGEYVAGMKRAIVDDGDDGDVLELAGDLWDVLDELEDVLETVDLEELPAAIDVGELPEAVDVENVPEGLFDEEEGVIELGKVREAVNLRELWEAVDLTQLYQEKRELDAAVDDVADDADAADEDLFENVVDNGEGAHVQFDAEARQAYLEEKILEAVEAFRTVLLSTHEKLRKLYLANQAKLGQPGHQPDSLNPTAASTMPPGPIPDSVSSRASTVPPQVRYSRVENPHRIFGRRFREATRDEDETTDASDTSVAADDDATADDDERATDDDETAVDGEAAADGDEPAADDDGAATDDDGAIELEVYEG